MKTYEGMFLLEAGQANFEEAVEPVRTLFTRNQAEVLHLKKWDERRLAYEIRGRRRGLYVLAYFKADPVKITDIERDAQLDEKVLRSLILTADQVSAEMMQAKTPAETHAGRPEGERERGEDEDREWRPRRDRDRDRDRDHDRGEGRRRREEAPPAVAAPPVVAAPQEVSDVAVENDKDASDEKSGE